MADIKSQFEIINEDGNPIPTTIKQGGYEAEVNPSGQLRVEATIPDGTNSVVQIEDGNGNGSKVEVTETGRLLVSTQSPTPPSNTDPVSDIAYSNMSGQQDEVYTVTNGKTLTISRMSAAGEDSNKGWKVELWDDPNGTGVGMTIIDVVFGNGSSDQHDLNHIIVGDGTKAVRLRRTHLTGGSIEIFGRWGGWES